MSTFAFFRMTGALRLLDKAAVPSPIRAPVQPALSRAAKACGAPTMSAGAVPGHLTNWPGTVRGAKAQHNDVRGAARRKSYSTTTAQQEDGVNGAGNPWHEPLHPGDVIPRNQLQGEDDWKDLFDSKAKNPIPDPAFLKELIKTGYLVQAAYSYLGEYDKEKGKYGLPMGNIPRITIPKMPGEHPAKQAASEYNMPDNECYITLATAGIYRGEFDKAIDLQNLSTNPIGYVALSGDGEDIAVVFRGTRTLQEWISNCTDLLSRWDDIEKTTAAGNGASVQDGVWVELGFGNMYRRFVSTPGNTLSVQGQIQKAVQSLLTAYPGVKSITVCGHSLGGALASMCAFDLASSEINKAGGKADGELIPVTCFTWEAPKVGNKVYASRFGPNAPKPADSQETRQAHPYVNMFRVVNKDDVVPRVPSDVIASRNLISDVRILEKILIGALGGQSSEQDSQSTAFVHGGTEVVVNLQNAWDNSQLDISKPANVDANVVKRFRLLLNQAHSLWLNMWLVDHNIEIPQDEKAGLNDGSTDKAHSTTLLVRIIEAT